METVFTLEATPIKFGPGAVDDAGWELQRLGVTRALLVTDPGIPHVERVLASLSCEVVVFDGSRVEPTLDSLQAAADFALEAEVDGFVSLGGGSAIDTAKVANLIVSHPAPVMEYVNAPIGGGRTPDGPLRPHLAIPTTCGTGSEATTVAVLDIPERRVKTGISHRYLRPSQAIVDPDLARTLPAEVVGGDRAGRGLPRGGVLPRAAVHVARAAGDARGPAALPGLQPRRGRVVGEGARVRR